MSDASAVEKMRDGPSGVDFPVQPQTQWARYKSLTLQQTGRAANRTSSKQDEQQTGRAANRTTSVPDPSPLTTMTIGLLGLDWLRNPLLTAAIGQLHEIRRSIRESHPLQKCEDGEPRIKRITRIRNLKILKTENGKRNFHRRALGLMLNPKIAQNRRSHTSKTADSRLNFPSEIRFNP